MVGAWYDGLTYNLLLASNVDDDTYMYRIGSELEAVPNNASPLGRRLVRDQTIRSASSLGDGRSMIVYTERDLTRFGDAVKARIIENGGI